MDKKLEKLNAYKKLETEIVLTLTWIELTSFKLSIFKS